MHTTDKPQDNTLLQQSVLIIKELKSKLKALEDKQREPIAVVGMGCRFPGAEDPGQFWQLLRNGVDAITEVPADRWSLDEYFDEDPAAAGKMYARYGGFIREPRAFDAPFFGISPREAEYLDPQQRLALEVSWQAVENAGLGAGALAGSKTGVYLGICANDYAGLVQDLTRVNAYYGTGNAFSTASGRLSYWFGFHGPSISVDTACSSSLVTVHLACQGLRSGECNLALAGGVGLMLSPKNSINFSKARMLAPDGRCKTFDEAANGYVRGEGCGMVVLKRLSDALADGDRILGLIRGSAVNQDGRSAGLTVPSELAQERVILSALDNAGVLPGQVSYVEAHGTGTSLGDPIEINALGEVFGKGRSRAESLLVGSVKTNVGHLEAAAGVAGLIKVLLAMQHGAIPPHLHCRNPSSRIGWNELPLQVPAALTPWETGGKARIAGVSSFSFSGTNAHVVLEEAPVPAPPVPAPGTGRSHHLLTVSARDEKALAELLARYADYASDAPDSLADICHTANGGRSHFDHRLAVVAGSRAELAAKLNALRAAGTVPGVKATAGKPPRVAFLFTGQGAQYAGMGKELYATHPVFRQAVDACDQILRGYLREPVVRVLFEADEKEGLIHRTEYTQPALFTLEYALAALWESWGIVPEYLAGHSVGEYVAACRAGVFSLEDGLKLIAWRGRLIQSLPENGGMLTAFAGAGQVEPFVQPYAGRVSVAAVNTARTVVLSGEKAALAVLAADLQRAGIETKKLTVSHAFHSPLMEPVLADFRQVAAGIAYAPPRIPVISNVTGRAVTTEMAGPDYWVNHVTAPVRFADGLAALDRAGVDAFVEIGPAPTLLSLGKRELAGRNAAWLPSLSPNRPAWEVLLESVGTLYAAGQPIDWNAFNGYLSPRKATLPGYPFAGETYWLDEQTTTGPARTPQALPLHPLIEKCVAAPLHREVLFEAAFGVAQLPFLADHKIYGSVIVPGAAHLSLLLGAGGLSWPGRSFTLSDIVFPQALVLADDEVARVQVSLRQTGPAAPVQVISYGTGEPDGSFVTHALAKAGVLDPAGPDVYLQVEAIKERCPLRLTGDDIYRAQSRNAIELGATFRWIQTVYQGGGEALCGMHFPEKLSAADGYQIHPGLIDSCFQLVLATLPEASRHTYVPFKIDQVTYYGRPVQGACYAYAALRTSSQPADGSLTADLELATPAGEVIARFGGVQVRRASPEALLGLARKNTAGPLCYETMWKPAEAGNYPDAAPVLACLLFADDKGRGEGLAAQLRAAGHDAVCVYKGEAFGQIDAAAFTVDPGCPDDYGRVLATLGARPGFAVNAVMHLWCLDDELTGAAAPDEPLLHRAQQHGAFSLAHLARALAGAGVHTLRRFGIVTRDTQDIAGISRPLQVQHATAWGMGASLAREYPDWHCLNIDLTATYPKDDAYYLYRELVLPYGETQVAYRHGARQIARVTRKSGTPPSPEGKLCRQDATYLVTGGLGALGLLTAAWLAEKGANCLALAGRSGAVSPAATQAVGRLEAAGVRVAVFRCDIADAADAGRLFEALEATMPPLKGIFHTAGVLDDGLLVNQSVPQIERVMGPKVRGTLHLHTYSRDLELDYFVCYSSIASALGSAGQAAYAAANGFMDGLVRYRNQYGLPAWGVNWGPWAGSGMAAGLSAAHQAGLKKQGIGLLDPGKAFAALEQLLRQGPGQSLVADIAWDALAGSQPGPAGRSLIAELTTTVAGRDPGADAAPVGFAQKLSACLSPKERQDLVLGQLKELVAEVMRLAPHQLDVHKPLNRLGLDSLMAVELKNKVHKQIGVEINVVRFMDDVDLTALGLELYDLLHLPAEPEETPRLTEILAGREVAGITPEMAEKMLENVDAYSEEEMDALLKQLMAKDES